MKTCEHGVIHNPELDEKHRSVEALCLKSLQAIGAYAEARGIPIVGARAMIFSGGLTGTINFILPKSMTRRDRTVVQKIAQAACGERAIVKLHFFYCIES